MSLCEHCIKGKWEKIDGVDTYVATPMRDYPKEKAILLLPDAFGPQLINTQLLAGDFATNGFKTYVPDYLNGDAVPPDALERDGGFDVMKWLLSHTQETTRPTLDKIVNALKEQDISTFGATGYCFGGRYVFDLAFDDIIKVAVVSHPSLLKIPDDLEKYISTAKAPLLINSCTTDSQFPLEASAKADALFGEGKFAPGYKREYFDGLTHGFAVRGDMSDPTAKAGKEGAFKAAVEWFIKNL